jgi:transposase
LRLLAYENLQICNVVKNHRLAKRLHDAAWSRFLLWVAYSAGLYGIPLLAVPPQYTTRGCSGCGTLVQKTLSTRTHVCHHCDLMLDGDVTRRVTSWPGRWHAGSTSPASAAGAVKATARTTSAVPPGRSELAHAD